MKLLKFTFFLLLLVLPQLSYGQGEPKNKELIRVFDLVSTALISEDESLLAIYNYKTIEIYSLDSLKLLHLIKIEPKIRLENSFFTDMNTILYCPYGSLFYPKFKQLNLKTGEKTRLKCEEVPKGCSYKSIKYCNWEKPILSLNQKPFFLKYDSYELTLSFYKVGVRT